MLAPLVGDDGDGHGADRTRAAPAREDVAVSPKSSNLTTQRLEALSDGVIAIAATLLILEIGRVEVHGDGGLFDAIIDLWPSYLAYIVSFVVIGLIPWPTSVVADYIGDGGINASVATALYSVTMTLIGVVFVGMWVHLVRHPEHTIESVTETQLRRSMRLALVSPIVYASTIALAFVSPF